MPCDVLYVAAECKPFSKAGGVGDVAGELPTALRAAGVDVEVVTPCYGSVPRHLVGAVRETFTVPFAGATELVTVHEGVGGAAPVSLVANATYFEGPTYGQPYVHSDAAPFRDDIVRFSFFSKACLELVRRRQPAIVHANDWPLAYLFGWMALEKLPPKRVLTVHNVSYQGNLWRPLVLGLDIAELLRRPETATAFLDPHPEWDSVNALRLGMELADRVATVSPTYADEMTRPEDPTRLFEGGKGLDGVAARAAREGRLVGVLNGFVYGAAPTDAGFEEVLARKAAARRELAVHFREPDRLLLGFVGRAVEQKFRLLVERVDGRPVLEHLLDMPDVNVAILATGLPAYEAFINAMAVGRYTGACWYDDLLSVPRRTNYTATLAFHPTLAGRLSLASDVFLMPSLFEPCGITQLEAMANGTPPLVRLTGGLADTVAPYPADGATGFGFAGEARDDVLRNLLGAVRDAATLYRTDRARFTALQRTAYRQRFEWSAAARRYVDDVYAGALRGKP